MTARIANDAVVGADYTVYAMENGSNKATFEFEIVETVVTQTDTPIEQSPPPTIPPPQANTGDLVVDDLSTPQDFTPGVVELILPLKYKGMPARRALRFLEVTPAIDDPKAWPFEIDSTSYLRTLNDFQSAMTPEGRLYDYIPYTFTVKPDMYNGYYLVSFNVRYQGAAENVWLTAPVEGKLSLYIKIVNGKPEPTPEPSYKPEATAKPIPEAKLILAGYTTDPASITAGQPFELTLDLFNTSSVTKVRNIKCTLTADESAVVPESGSSTFYIDEIDKGEHHMETITFTSQTSAGLKPAQLTLKMEYEDQTLKQLTATELFTVALRPIINLTLDNPRYQEEVMAGDQFNLMMNLYNKGKSPLYNVTVSIESDRLEPEELYFAGNMEAGSSRTYDTMVTLHARPGEKGSASGMSGGGSPMYRSVSVMGGMAVAVSESAVAPAPAPSGIGGTGGDDAEDPGEDWVDPGYAEGVIVVTYEDSFGIEAREEMPIRVNVMQMPEYDMPMFNDKGEMIDPATGLPIATAPEAAGAPLWLLITGAALIVVIAPIMTVLAVRLRRRKRQDNEMV